MPSPPLDHQLRADPFSVLLSNNHPWSFNLPSPLVNSIGPLFFHDGPRDFHLDFLWRFHRPRFFFFCEKITTSSESTAEPHVAHLYGKYDFPVFPHIYIRLAHARFPTNTPYVETLRSIPTKTPPLPVRTFLPTRCTTITLLEHFFSFLPFFMSYFLPAHSRTSNRWPQAETCVTLIFSTFLFVRSFGYTTDDSRAYPASLTANIINRYYNDHIFIELNYKNGKMQGHPFLVWLFPWNSERNNQMEQN